MQGSHFHYLVGFCYGFIRVDPRVSAAENVCELPAFYSCQPEAKSGDLQPGIT
jgi:hypothetical protein